MNHMRMITTLKNPVARPIAQNRTKGTKDARGWGRRSTKRFGIALQDSQIRRGEQETGFQRVRDVRVATGGHGSTGNQNGSYLREICMHARGSFYSR